MPAESSVRYEELPSFKDLKSRRGVSPADSCSFHLCSGTAPCPPQAGGRAALRLLSLALPGHWHPGAGASLLISNEPGREFKGKKRAGFPSDLQAASLPSSWPHGIFQHNSFLVLRFSLNFCLHGAVTPGQGRSGSLILQEQDWISLGWSLGWSRAPWL